MERAASSGADIIQLDLENATPASDKSSARDGARTGLTSIDWGTSEVWVRVNAADSGLMEDDVEAVVASVPDALVLAKVSTADEVRRLAALVANAEERSGLTAGRIRLAVVVESARGLSNVEEIASAHPRMTALSIGANDLTRDLGVWRDPTGPGLELLYAKSRCVLAARLAGIDACDNAYPLAADRVGLVRSTEQTFRMGFATKTCWTADQVETIHAVHALRKEHVDIGARAARGQA
jgi:citrate lyase subunit beta/citryl-CoA lyase